MLGYINEYKSFMPNVNGEPSYCYKKHVDDPKNDPKELTERQRNILHTIEEDTSLTRKQLTQRLNVSDSTIKRQISFFRQEGYLDRKGGNTYAIWVILKSFK